MAPSKQPKHYSTLYLKECLLKLAAIFVEFFVSPIQSPSLRTNTSAIKNLKRTKYVEVLRGGLLDNYYLVHISTPKMYYLRKKHLHDYLIAQSNQN